MGIISIEQTDRLYWLGRYTERVYSTMRLYMETYDIMIDSTTEQYEKFCEKLDIPPVYTSGEDFCEKYPFDEEDANSLISNLRRAYDNAIVLREEIGSESLAHIQLAIYDMQRAKAVNAPVLEFQKVLDNLMAFWGVVDDQIASENVRNILKVGKRVERIDLYARLENTRENLTREVHRLAGRVNRCNLKYRKDVVENLMQFVEEEPLDYDKIVREIEQFLEV